MRWMQWIAVDDATPIANNAKFPMLRGFYLAINHIILNRQWQMSMRLPRHAPSNTKNLIVPYSVILGLTAQGDGDRLFITPESTP
jgi:hypothetical protein